MFIVADLVSLSTTLYFHKKDVESASNKYMYLRINPLYTGRETSKLLQTVKTQMKCRMLRHFIWVYTVCLGKKDIQTKMQYVLLNYNLAPLDMYNGPLSNQKENPINIQRV